MGDTQVDAELTIEGQKVCRLHYFTYYPDRGISCTGCEDGAEPVWTTKSGEIIPLSKLEDRHLENIINLMKRREPVIRNALFEYFLCLGTPNGDMAMMAWEGALAELGDADLEHIYPPYGALLNERDKRRRSHKTWYDV